MVKVTTYNGDLGKFKSKKEGGQIKTKQIQIQTQTYTCTFFNRHIFFTFTRLYQQFLKDLPNITFYSTKKNLRVIYKNF